MPKAKRIRSAALAAQLTRHQPLGQVLAQDAAEQAHGKLTSRRKKMKKGGRPRSEDDTADDLLLDAKTSQRILELSKRQQLEMETEEQQQQQAATDLRRGTTNRRSAAPKRQIERQQNDSDDDEDDAEEDDDDSNEAWEDDTGDGMIVRDTNDRYISVAEGTLSPEDEALVNAMMNPSNSSNSGQQQPRQSLADIILAKIDEKESAVLALSSSQHSQQPSAASGGAALPPKVVHVYTEIGKLLSRYTSGKLPKAFKVIPSLTHWEDVLYLTRPDLWTPQSMYAATRIFASNLNPHMAQRFYNLVLLDAVRADIQHNKKLNYHYYMALKKGKNRS
jgi:essential nuclear protein 1